MPPPPAYDEPKSPPLEAHAPTATTSRGSGGQLTRAAARNEHHIGMARRCDEVHAVLCKIVYGTAELSHLEVTAVAGADVEMTDMERAAVELVDGFSECFTLFFVHRTSPFRIRSSSRVRAAILSSFVWISPRLPHCATHMPQKIHLSYAISMTAFLGLPLMRSAPVGQACSQLPQTRHALRSNSIIPRRAACGSGSEWFGATVPVFHILSIVSSIFYSPFLSGHSTSSTTRSFC